MRLNSNDSNSIWVGTFADANQASSAAMELNPKNGTAFATKKWLARQREMLLSAKNGINSRNSNLPILCALFERENNLSVYDLGEGSGWIYEYLKHSLKRPLSYLNLNKNLLWIQVSDLRTTQI